MAKKTESHTPSFFDEPEVVVEDDADELDEWHDVSHAHFLSWSPRVQIHYCWRRDLDAALRTDNDSDAAFYLDRAARYKAELDTYQ